MSSDTDEERIASWLNNIGKDPVPRPWIPPTANNDSTAKEGTAGEAATSTEKKTATDIETYTPYVIRGVWYVKPLDVAWIAEGSIVLGGGSGGSTKHALKLAQQLSVYGEGIRIKPMGSLPGDTILLRGGDRHRPWLPSEREIKPRDVLAALHEMRSGRDICKKKPLGACISDETGGGNSVQTLVFAGFLGKPVIDADLQNWDAGGDMMMIPPLALYGPAPLYLRDVEEYARHHVVSTCWWLGRAIALCRHRQQISSIPAALFEHRPGRVLFIGRVIKDSRPDTSRTRGQLRLQALSESQGNDANDEAGPVFSGEAELGIDGRWGAFSSLKKRDGPPPYSFVSAEKWAEERVSAGESGKVVEIHEKLKGRVLTIIVLFGDPKAYPAEDLDDAGQVRFKVRTDRWRDSGHWISTVGTYRSPKSVIESYGQARV